MNFEDLFKTTWEHFVKKIVDLILFTLVGLVLCLTIVLIPAVLGGWTRGVIAMVRDDKKLVFEDLWRFDQYGSILALLVFGGILVSVGFILLFVPGVILSVLWMYSLFFIIDRKLGFIEAMGASAQAVTKDGFFQHLIVWIIISVLHGLGAALSGAGTLVTLPFIFVFLAVVYLGWGRAAEHPIPALTT